MDVGIRLMSNVSAFVLALLMKSPIGILAQEKYVGTWACSHAVGSLGFNLVQI